MGSRRRGELDDLFRDAQAHPPDALRPLIFEHGNFVPGAGTFEPKVILVGEAPGLHEDKKRVPFVGQSGRLLDAALEAAGLSRAEVWITNVVKYRPRNNRTPEPEEIEASLPLLRREVRLVAGERRVPFVALGGTALSALTGGSNTAIGRCHGTWIKLKAGRKVFVSYHPAAGLRNRTVTHTILADFAKLSADLRIDDLADKGWPIKPTVGVGGPGNYRGRRDRLN